MIDPFASVTDLGTFKVYAPIGLTDTGRQRRWQTRTVSKLAEAAVHFRDDLNQALYEVISRTYTEGEGTLAATTQARLGRTSRDAVEVDVFTGAQHAIYLTAAAPGGQPGTAHDIVPTSSKALTFFWKSPPSDVGPPGVYSFKHVTWRPHNIAPGEDPIADLLSYYAARFQSVMLAAHGTALTEFIEGSDGQLVEVA